MTSSIPPEISKCISLNHLRLDNCSGQIKLPKGIIMVGLERVIIGGGEWNEEMIRTFLLCLASFAPKLKKFGVCKQTRENANLFLNGLSQNDSFIDLDCISFEACNLIEEDTKRLTFIFLPLYSKLASLDL
jgi:hypothetical protein